MRKNTKETWTSWIIRFLNRIFRYPVRAEPVSYVLQHHYDSMGNLLPAEQRASRRPDYHLNELEVVEKQFYEQLRRRRRERFEKAFQQARRDRPDEQSQHELTTDLSKWPGWDSTTLQNLSNLFALYVCREGGLLDEQRASALCVDLGDKSAPQELRVRFHAADTDGDGWLDFEDMLTMLYNAETTNVNMETESEERGVPVEQSEPQEQEGEEELPTEAPLDDEEEARRALRPLARSCYEKSQRAAVLASMTAQTQIEYGFL